MDIIINLNNSLYAHEFNTSNKIHAADMDRVKNIIRSQIDEIDTIPEGNFILNHIYRTIGIFGDRGSGKTSFLISLLEECNKEFTDIQVLNIIDPTLIEHKKPIILCIISMINQLVEKKLCCQECSQSSTIYHIKQNWENILKDIALGIHAIDEVGTGYDDSLWQDEEFVMYKGLHKVNKANEFEKSLRKMFKSALDILGKKAFILTFDDIDVDIKQGWNVLETLRRYLSDSHIISIVSGNIKLYGMLVRSELCKNLSIRNHQSRTIMENELESQYMLKILSPSNRINLRSLSDIIQNNTISIIRNNNDSTPLELKAAYRTILSKLRITDTSSQKIFTDFFLSMSLRSQIHFLKDFLDSANNSPSLDVFAARLYAVNIDIKTLELNAQLTNIIILNYLCTTNNLADCYLLLPTLANKDINSNFTALTLIASQHFRKSPHAIFDYMLRIGYLRNIILPLENSQTITQLCKYGNWNQIISLKNSIGLTMAYMDGHKIGNSQRLHIPLFRLEKTAKKSVENALDRVLKEETSYLNKLLAMFPFIQIQNTNNNESSSFYSIFSLIAVIGELLKCDSGSEMIATINDLKQFRSYMKPQDESSNDSETKQDSFGINIDPTAITTLATEMYRWKHDYQNATPLPPYAIGRIMTRLYSSVINISQDTVGKNMNLMVAAFFNACLIEEARLKLSNQDQGQINNNNPRTTTDVFINNLHTLKQYNLSFSIWIISCPMLNCFLDQETVAMISQHLFRPFIPITSTLMALLDNIQCKNTDETKPSFLASEDRIQETLNILKNNGITDQDINIHIIQADTEHAVQYLRDTGLFSSVTTRSVRKFKNIYSTNR